MKEFRQKMGVNRENQFRKMRQFSTLAPRKLVPRKLVTAKISSLKVCTIDAHFPWTILAFSLNVEPR